VIIHQPEKTIMPQALNARKHHPAQTVEGLYSRHHRRSQPVYLILIATVIVVAAALPFISIEVGSEARAVLQTTQRPTSIHSPAAGKVLYARLRDNLEVTTGDTLLVFDAAELNTEYDYLDKKTSESRAAGKDLNELINSLPVNGYPQLTTSLYQRDYQDFRHQWDAATLKVAHAKKQLERQEILFATGTISQMDIERYRFDHELAGSEQTQLEERRRHLWAQELDRHRQVLADLRRTSASLHLRSRQLVITASTSGHLVNTVELQPGSYVGPAQEIAMISPAGELEVSVHVAPRDIGLLRVGTSVSLRMDAFTHTQWGFANATVKEISNDVTTDQGGNPVFIVRCHLREDVLQLPSGHQGMLTKGMTATAHFILARRTLAQLLRDRLEDWLPVPQIVNS